MTRILTTHTGSLPRPSDLVAVLRKQHAAEPYDPANLAALTEDAVLQVVRRQRDTGIDIINDGEMGKVGYSVYVRYRLNGFDGEVQTAGLPELRDFREFAKRLDPSLQLARSPACSGPISVRDPDAVHRDIAALSAAVGADGLDQAFMTAASPGVISVFFGNNYYPSREAFLAALVDAMRQEYRAIVDSGLILQIDCPDLAMGRHMQFADLDAKAFRREARLNVEALNAAVADLPQDRIRIHLCWGNYEAPHHLDIPLKEIIDIVLQATPSGISIEACNPRHAHEWAVFRDVRLPEGKYLIPGVIDSTSNYIEHPELVAQRIRNYADIVGPARVVAGTDCGFGTFAGMAQVEPRIAWAKLGSMVEGAAIASSELQRAGR